MASLSFARPGKVSERQYLGDLAGLFERHRRRAGIALTPESFAADLAECDALRSALFTLCTAISHMGERDLSPEELLDLVARALCGAGSAEGETGAPIPEDMREAFLSGYVAWLDRDMHPIAGLGRAETWPPIAPAARKSAQRDTAPDNISLDAVAAGGGPDEPLPTPGHRTVQEALSLTRDERTGTEDQSSPQPVFPGVGGADADSITLGELKHFLEEIEHRVSRLGPHLQQLKPVAREPARRERPALLPDGVIPFPDRRGRIVDELDAPSDFEFETVAPHRPSSGLRAEDAYVAKAPEADDRPPGIDALLAAAPAWARATPTARSFDEEAFLSRHAYLSPARRPGTFAPASLYYVETPAQPLAPPPAAPVQATPMFTAAAFASPVPARIGLDVEDDPLLSPMERLQAYVLRLSPRKVFLALASLTVLAGGLAGLMAYRTLHGRVPQFKDLKSSVPFGATPPSSPVLPAADAAISQTASAVTTGHTSPSVPAVVTAPTTIASAPQSAVVVESRRKPHASPVHMPAVAVWPPVPRQIAHDAASAPVPAPSAYNARTATEPHSGPPYVPPSTMIGYALATPQPASPAAQAHGIAGTVVVEITVSRLGDVTSAHAVSGPPELRSAAIAAVRGWRFRPYLVDGSPVEVSTTLRFLFKGD